MQTIEIKKQQQEKQNERTYPYMGMTKDKCIVWFTKPNTGVAIKNATTGHTMAIVNIWNEDNFTPMQGEYTFKFDNK